MRIQAINYLPYRNINFRKNENALRHYKVEKDNYNKKIEYDQELLENVAKKHKAIMFRILQDCEAFGKEEFPNDKVTVFFNAKRIKNTSERMDYYIGLGVNTDAPQGIMKEDSLMPGFPYISGSKFYYMKTISTVGSRDLNYNELKNHILTDIKNSIEEDRGKKQEKEAEPTEKEGFFKRLFNKLFKENPQVKGALVKKNSR